MCVPQHDCSGCPDLVETPYQSLCFGRKHETLLCFVGHFSKSGFEFCSPCRPRKSTCSPANALARGRRYIPSFREIRESRTCCPHGRTNLSDRWRTAQIALPENTQQFRASEGLCYSPSLPLEWSPWLGAVNSRLHHRCKDQHFWKQVDYSKAIYRIFNPNR